VASSPPSRTIKDVAAIPDARVLPAPVRRAAVTHPCRRNAPPYSWLRAVIKEIAAVRQWTTRIGGNRRRRAGLRHGSSAASVPIASQWRSRPRPPVALLFPGSRPIAAGYGRSLAGFPAAVTAIIRIYAWLAACSQPRVVVRRSWREHRAIAGRQTAMPRARKRDRMRGQTGSIRRGPVMPALEARHAQSNRVGVFSPRGQTCVTMP
jgi:hypothetical protein